MRRYEPIDTSGYAAASLPLKPAGSYLITGGLGGIGLQLAGWLARQASARLLLTARRALPYRNEWDAVLREPEANDWRVRVVDQKDARPRAPKPMPAPLPDVAIFRPWRARSIWHVHAGVRSMVSFTQPVLPAMA